MKIEFIGPPQMMADGGVSYLAKLDGHPIECCFSYEALEDADTESIFGNALDHFAKHQLKMLSIAEQKMLDGHTHDGKLLVSSGDLQGD